MSDELEPGAAVTRSDLFRLIADEAIRDGIIEPREDEILRKMAGFLRLSVPRATEIMNEARDRYQRGVLGEPRALSPDDLYATALSYILSDGVIDANEDKMLTGLRIVLGMEAGA